MILADVPPKIWMPQKPAIIRPAPAKLRCSTAGLVAMNFLPGWFPAGAVARADAAPAAAIITHTDDDVAAANAATYNFTGLSFGAAEVGDYILANFTARAASARNVNSVTIDGQSATILINTTGVNNQSIFALAEAQGNASGTVSVAWSGTMVRCSCVVWRVQNLQSTVPQDTIPMQASLSGNIDAVADGFIAAAGFTSANSSSATWTGLTEDVFYGSGAWENDGNMSAASQNFTADDTNRSVSVSFSGGTEFDAFSAVSMR